MFVDRETEMAALAVLLARPGAQFAIVYGRQRMGKTTLLLKHFIHRPTTFPSTTT
jgi:AAA+ ATPase superfamily predicted ATPase